MILIHSNLGSCTIVLPIPDALASVSILMGLSTRDGRIRSRRRIRIRIGRKTT